MFYISVGLILGSISNLDLLPMTVYLLIRWTLSFAVRIKEEMILRFVKFCPYSLPK